MKLDRNFQLEKITLQLLMKEFIQIFEEVKVTTGEFERVNRDDSDLIVTVDLKNAAAKKMRLSITGYYQGEYMYMLTKDGLIMNHKEYSIAKIKNKI